MMCSNIQAVPLFFEVIIFKKIYEVISIINLKNKLFKGVTRGDPWAPSLVEQNLNRTQKYKVTALKKIEKTFVKDVKRGDPCVPSLMKQTLNRTKCMKSFTA